MVICRESVAQVYGISYHNLYKVPDYPVRFCNILKWNLKLNKVRKVCNGILFFCDLECSAVFGKSAMPAKPSAMLAFSSALHFFCACRSTAKNVKFLHHPSYPSSGR